MDPTPFEHEALVAVAAYCTAPCRVAPLAGEVTMTPADAADAHTARREAVTRIDFMQTGIQFSMP
jgi:hypothetical protein